ncbi:hypothetical protein [Borreliella mayonii]|uniref:hypothetical protein n=1 Tax=Borreliella mayonii TaxID=1674146 RepID=UPI000B19A0F8|nr:hypothetical protein [Borreliella mayonii]
MKHILEIQKNIALITTRLSKTDRFSHAFVTYKISESSIIPLGYIFPLYIQEFIYKKMAEHLKEVKRKL